MINLKVDMTSLDDTVDEVAAAGAALSDPQFIALAGQEIRAKLKEWFYEHADALAAETPETLHHVYEWGMAGQDGGRLFEILTIGSNQFSSRVSYTFLPSQTNVPRDSGFDKDLRTRDHVFTYKAWVFEQGGPDDGTGMVDIAPQEDNEGGPLGTGVLAFPGDGQMAYSFRLRIPFTQQSMGQFAMIWNEWWDNMAEPLLQERFNKAGQTSLKHTIEMRIKNAGQNPNFSPNVRPTIQKNTAMKAAVEKEVLRIIKSA